MTIRHPLILSALTSRPWAATPATIDAVARALHAAQVGARAEEPLAAPAKPSARRMAAAGQMVTATVTPTPTVAVLPVFGIIGKYLSWAESWCGGFDLRDFQEELQALAVDPAVTDIVLHIHSPGGTVTGVAEAASLIAQVNQTKPVYAFTDSEMCSAAYWLACSGSGVFATDLACVGSIGVYLAWIDQARWMDKEGYDLKLFKSGEFKASTMPGQMSEGAAAHLQAEVDGIAKSFRAWVTARRALCEAAVEPTAMEGQTFLGSAAVSQGLVDKTYPSLDAFLSELLTA